MNPASQAGKIINAGRVGVGIVIESGDRGRARVPESDNGRAESIDFTTPLVAPLGACALAGETLPGSGRASAV
jgi:hypothetical protein